MADKALYFPYINVPDTAWFTRLLLYWDKVGSIVPFEYAYNPHLLSPHMRELVAAELVELVNPAEHVYKIPNFTSAFLDVVDRHRGRVAPSIARRGDLELRPVRLHIEKLGAIADELVQRRLITVAGYPWFDAQPWVASAFMAYLAGTLGRIPDVNADPVTNERASFYQLGGEREVARARARARSVILKQIMPFPAGPIAIREIADFKETYGHLLQQLRRCVEGKCIEIANIQDPAARQERAEGIAAELTDEIEALVDAMRQRWPRVIMLALVPILGAIAALAGGEDALAALSGVGGLATAAYGAFDIGRVERAHDSKPLAYAAFAHRRFPQLLPLEH